MAKAKKSIKPEKFFLSEDPSDLSCLTYYEDQGVRYFYVTDDNATDLLELSNEEQSSGFFETIIFALQNNFEIGLTHLKLSFQDPPVVYIKDGEITIQCDNSSKTIVLTDEIREVLINAFTYLSA